MIIIYKRDAYEVTVPVKRDEQDAQNLIEWLKENAQFQHKGGIHEFMLELPKDLEDGPRKLYGDDIPMSILSFFQGIGENNLFCAGQTYLRIMFI